MRRVPALRSAPSPKARAVPRGHATAAAWLLAFRRVGGRWRSDGDITFCGRGMGNPAATSVHLGIGSPGQSLCARPAYRGDGRWLVPAASRPLRPAEAVHLSRTGRGSRPASPPHRTLIATRGCRPRRRRTAPLARDGRGRALSGAGRGLRGEHRRPACTATARLTDSSALPHSRTPALPHSRTPALPHSRTPFPLAIPSVPLTFMRPPMARRLRAARGPENDPRTTHRICRCRRRSTPAGRS